MRTASLTRFEVAQFELVIAITAPSPPNCSRAKRSIPTRFFANHLGERAGVRGARRDNCLVCLSEFSVAVPRLIPLTPTLSPKNLPIKVELFGTLERGKF